MMQVGKRVLGMPGRIVVAVGVSLCLAAGLAAPLGPVAYAKTTTTNGKGTVEETKAEPTALAITLQTGGGSGSNVTVGDHTPVRASVALTGTNAATARGTVSYAIYSDAGCTNEVAWGGPRLIRSGGESPPERLAPGTYYWQATYSGDAKDGPSVSACGAAVETAEGGEGDPLISGCTQVSGEAQLSIEGGHVVVRDRLSSVLEGEQKLAIAWGGRHRVRLTKLLGVGCSVGRTGSHLHGVGEARMDGESGYTMRFNIRVSKNGEEFVRIRVRNARREPVAEIVGSPAPGSEVFS